MGRWKIDLPLILAAGFAAGWLGFRGEQQRQESGEKAPPPLRKQLRQIFVPPADAVTRLLEIRNRTKRVGMNSTDEEECWQILREFSAEQIRACLAELPPPDPQASTADRLTQMLFYRWAQIDPLTAMSEAKKPPYDRSGALVAAFSCWATRDREAALRWAAGPDGGDLKNYAGRVAARLAFQENPLTAIAQVQSLFPDAVSEIVGDLARRGDGSEGSVRTFLEQIHGLGDPRSWSFAAAQMAKQWVKQNPGQALQSTETFGLEPTQLASFRTSVLMAASEKDPTQVLDRLNQRQESALGAKESQATMVSVLLTCGGDTTRWAVEHQQPDLLSQALNSRVEWLQRARTPLVVMMPTIRPQFQGWQQLQPESAQAWLQQQTPEIRNLLNPPTVPDHGTN